MERHRDRDVLAPGERVLGRYEVVRVLGEGGAGQVYQARDTSGVAGEDVALKVLADAPLLKPADRERLTKRFHREWAILKDHPHPNLPAVFDYGEHDRMPVIAMEFLDGLDLAQVLRRERRLSVSDTLYVGIEAARALRHAHGRGIVHRDVKPHNIFCSRGRPREGRSIVRLLDLGVAKITGAEKLTRENAVIGTRRYMAPEAFARPHSVDDKTDQYALGVALFECLTGRWPFACDLSEEEELWLDPQQIMYMVVHKRVQLVHVYRPEVPAPVAEAIDRMMRKEPAARFSDMEVAKLALQQLLGDMDRAASRVGKRLPTIFFRERGTVLTGEAGGPVAAPATTEPEVPRAPEAWLERGVSRLRELAKDDTPGSREVLERALSANVLEFRRAASDGLLAVGNALSLLPLARAIRNETDPKLRELMRATHEVIRRKSQAVATVYEESPLGHEPIDVRRGPKGEDVPRARGEPTAGRAERAGAEPAHTARPAPPPQPTRAPRPESARAAIVAPERTRRERGDGAPGPARVALSRRRARRLEILAAALGVLVATAIGLAFLAFR
jgi:predicted Ser/Thr protein kinase